MYIICFAVTVIQFAETGHTSMKTAVLSISAVFILFCGPFVAGLIVLSADYFTDIYLRMRSEFSGRAFHEHEISALLEFDFRETIAILFCFWKAVASIPIIRRLYLPVSIISPSVSIIALVGMFAEKDFAFYVPFFIGSSLISLSLIFQIYSGLCLEAAYYRNKPNFLTYNGGSVMWISSIIIPRLLKSLLDFNSVSLALSEAKNMHETIRTSSCCDS